MTSQKAHLLNLAELLVDAVVVVFHVHCRREYLVLEFLGESMQAPVLDEKDGVARRSTHTRREGETDGRSQAVRHGDCARAFPEGAEGPTRVNVRRTAAIIHVVQTSQPATTAAGCTPHA